MGNPKQERTEAIKNKTAPRRFYLRPQEMAVGVGTLRIRSLVAHMCKDLAALDLNVPIASRTYAPANKFRVAFLII